MILQEGSKVIMKKCSAISELAIGKTGVIEEIRFPFGEHAVFEIKLDEPIIHEWGTELFIRCYDWEDCFALLE